MSDSSEDMVMRSDDAVEALLEKALPRPAPPPQDEQLVRDAVHAEWQSVTGRRENRRRLRNFAIAATVLLAVTVTFNAFRMNGVAPVQVATISKSHGSIYLLGEQSELHELPDLGAISAGQTIVTSNDAGIGLEWGNGGSLRIDENTRIEFLSSDSIYLRSGRVYFDSAPTGQVASISGIPGSGGSGPVFEIETGHGTVTHLGTQYMTEADDKTLLVSVREGKVAVEGVRYDETIGEGKQLTMSGSARAITVDFPRHGAAWEWTEIIAPEPDLDGRPVHDFLQWVSRETGLALEYNSAAAERLANDEMFRGTIHDKPLKTLELWMQVIDLNYDVEAGVIYVSAADTRSGP